MPKLKEKYEVKVKEGVKGEPKNGGKVKHTLFVNITPWKEISFFVSCAFFRGNRMVLHSSKNAKQAV